MTSNTSNAVTVVEAQPVALAAQAPATPEAMLMMAVERGADIATLKEIMAMGDKIRKEAAERAFYDALAAAQGEFPPIEKTRVVEGRYKYASLDDLMDRITPVLQKHRLSTSFERAFVSNEAGLITAVSSALVVRHGDGHTHTFAPVIMPTDGAARMNKTQQVGCAMTYADRYAYQGGLGFRPCDEDTDGKPHQTPPPAAQGPQRSSAAPSAPAPAPATQAAPQDKNVSRVHPDALPGWGLVHLSAIKEGTTKKGAAYISFSVTERPEAKMISAFKKDHIEMLRTAHSRQCWVFIRCVMSEDKKFINLEDVAWPAEPKTDADMQPALDPSCDDPRNYPQPTQAELDRQDEDSALEGAPDDLLPF